MLMKASLNRIALAAMSCALAACGGGGGGGGDNQAAAPPAITPPAITPAPVVNATASLTNSGEFAVVGSNITLAWSSTDATTCTASGAWSGDVGKSGTKSITPNASGMTQYTITCGSATASASVETLPESYAIPDVKFEQFLVANGHDDLVDGKVDTIKALGVNRIRMLSEAGVTNLDGIEAFRNIAKLEVYHQRGLPRIDPTKLTKLELLGVWDCPISTIDVSKNIKLLTFSVNETEVSTVDVSTLAKVEDLNFSNSEGRFYSLTPYYGKTKGLIALDVTKNLNLRRLTVDANRLTSIDTSKNPQLTEFWGSYNRFTSLDFSKGNPRLWRVVVVGTPDMASTLSSLNVKNTDMTANIVNNKISQVTTYNNPLLKQVSVSNLSAIQAVIATRPHDLIEGQARNSGFVLDSWTVLTEQ